MSRHPALEVAMSPAEWSTWAILRSLSPTDLRTRPCAAAAEILQITLRRARRHLHAIRAAGLAFPAGKHGLRIVVPGEGSDLDAIEFVAETYARQTRASWRDAPDGFGGLAMPIFAAGRRLATGPIAPPPVCPPEPPSHRRKIGFVLPGDDPTDHSVPPDPARDTGEIGGQSVCHAPEHDRGGAASTQDRRRVGHTGLSSRVSSTDPATTEDARGAVCFTSSSADQKDNSTPTERSERLRNRDRLVRTIKAHVTRDRETPRVKQAKADGRAFARLYKIRRKKIDPEYDMGPGDTAHLRRAVERLKKRKIGPVLWPRYLDFVFKVFPKAAEGRCAFAPAAQAASAGWIEQFVATLGERPYSLEDADDVLIAGGFDLPGHKVISALDWAVKLKYGRTVPPRLEAENPEEWEQVKYLADHLDEVGFDDDPEGGND